MSQTVSAASVTTTNPAAGPEASVVSPPSDLAATIAELRAVVTAGTTRPRAWREAKLDALVAYIDEREAAITEALRSDLGRDQFNSWAVDLMVPKLEAAHAKKKLGRWMRPQRVPVPVTSQPGRAWVQPDPKGVVLIIAPWNYPMHLAIAPLIAALAAGNTAVIKPSEMTPATSAELAHNLPRYLGHDAVCVVEGGVEATTELLRHRFDHILFTGSTRVGQIVMEAASKHLTPVTLELGGKSPTIVAASANLDAAAHRIAWAKSINAGQTCIAPDYVLVEESVADELVDRLSQKLPELYGAAGNQTSIVNGQHSARLESLLTDHGGEVALEGGTGPDGAFRPAVIRNPASTAPVMAEEIFGPILPVLTVPDLDAAIAYVNAGEKPLALYLFTGDRSDETAVLERTSSGGVVINHAIHQFLVTDLPFGGVGHSGMGAYHGLSGFDTFSHSKAVVRKPRGMELPLAYPPYPKPVQRVMRFLAR
jgi:aldehyde dehydrogenase (NAD+)